MNDFTFPPEVRCRCNQCEQINLPTQKRCSRRNCNAPLTIYGTMVCQDASGRWVSYVYRGDDTKPDPKPKPEPKPKLEPKPRPEPKPKPKPEPKPKPAPDPRKKALWWIIPLVIVLIAAVALLLRNCGPAPLPVPTTPTDSGMAVFPWEHNVLMSDPPGDINEWGYYSDPELARVLGSSYRREQISSVTFLDTLEDRGSNAWDVSAARDGSVMAWTEKNGDLYDLYIAGDGGISAEDCTGLFAGYGNMAYIHFGSIFHTGNATTMAQMFQNCYGLETLTLGDEFDTSSVTDMRYMFYHCSDLKTLTLGDKFDTSSVTDMRYMFQGCHDLKTLLLGDKFDASNVWNVSNMFHHTPGISLDDLKNIRWNPYAEHYQFMNGTGWEYLFGE